MKTGHTARIVLGLVAALMAPLAAQPQRRVPAAPPVPSLPPPAVERPVPFAVGERLSYDISWSSFLTAATATITVRDKKPSYGSTAYYVVAEGSAASLVAALYYPLYYKADTLLDVYSLLPQRFSLFSRERGKQEIRETLFDRGTARYSVRDQRTGVTTLNRTVKVPPGTHDPLSVLFWMRTLDLRTGLRATVPVIFNETIYRVELRVDGQEPIGSRTGARRAWRITPSVVDDKAKTAPRKMSVWISDDKRRVPVRMEVELAFGKFEFTLTGR